MGERVGSHTGLGVGRVNAVFGQRRGAKRSEVSCIMKCVVGLGQLREVLSKSLLVFLLFVLTRLSSSLFTFCFCLTPFLFRAFFFSTLACEK